MTEVKEVPSTPKLPQAPARKTDSTDDDEAMEEAGIEFVEDRPGDLL